MEEEKHGGLDPESGSGGSQAQADWLSQISFEPRCDVWLPRWRHYLQMVMVNIGLWMKHSF